MTTTRTASPELPDLDTVIAYLLGEGPLIGQNFGDKPLDGTPYWWRAYLRAAARRAQPEGEAPQAKPVAWMVPIEGVYEYFATEQAARKERAVYEQEMSGDHDLEYVAPVPLYEHAATLSPLCGAQHAESGPFYELFKFTLGSLALYNLDEARDIGGKYRAALAAQLDGGQEGSGSNG